jgi:thymidylate synthase
MYQYQSLIQDILIDGINKGDRTGTGTRSILGELRRYPLRQDDRPVLPMVTVKETRERPVKRELLWFIRGETNIKTLGAKIWDEWADENGDLGPIYGKQWRCWTDTKICDAEGERRLELEDRGYEVEGMLDGGPVPRVVMTRQIDQLQDAIEMLRTDPDSRRIIVSAWNPGDIPDMALPPCHSFFQFFSEEVDGKRFLTCLLYQRSADVFLGVPFNIASYALLTHMVAAVTNHTALELIHVTGDTHLYQNHLDLAEGLLRAPTYALPTLLLADRMDIDEFQEDDISILDYKSGPFIKAPVAV